MTENKNYNNAPQSIRDFIYYEQIVKGRSELTVKNYFNDLKSFFRFYKIKNGLANEKDFSTIDISDISDDDIKSVDLQYAQEFLIFMQTKMANQQKARYRKAVTLRQFYKFLTNNKNMFEVSPMANLELPSPKPALPKYLTLEQSLELLVNVDTPDTKRDYCIIVFFLNCGMRLSELVGINMSDIRKTRDKDGNEIYSMKVLGKGSKERIIYLNDACVNAYYDYISPEITDPDIRNEKGLRDMSAQTDALFLSRRRTRISNRRVQQIVEDCLKKSGLDNMGLSVHKLRHTAATLMYQNGVDVRVLKDVLGHENLNTTQIYTHVSNAQMENAMKKNPLASVNNKSKNDKG
ncbi:MAG: tyrosine-type recombinase/integrase [Oscillospiraceae bacterium]|nr:tyrosine-type recombinase/integrase [Oscillospiraceae bacterium]